MIDYKRHYNMKLISIIIESLIADIKDSELKQEIIKAIKENTV